MDAADDGGWRRGLGGSRWGRPARVGPRARPIWYAGGGTPSLASGVKDAGSLGNGVGWWLGCGC